MLKTDARVGLFHILTTDIYRNGAETAETARMMQCLKDSKINPTGMEKLELYYLKNK